MQYRRLEDENIAGASKGRKGGRTQCRRNENTRAIPSTVDKDKQRATHGS